VVEGIFNTGAGIVQFKEVLLVYSVSGAVVEESLPAEAAGSGIFDEALKGAAAGSAEK
jgi:hypothetical protein